jgi:hypothetical protein
MSLILSMYSLSQIHLAYCLLTYAEIVKFHNPSLALMNLHNGSDKINNNRTAKATSAIPIAGILVAAALLLGLLSVIGGETAIAQQNMTGTNATAANATAANATAANATAANATAANATAANATAANATAANATGATTGNQTAAGNQTGTAATTGGNNTAGTAGGGEGTTAGGLTAGQGEGSGGGAASY